MSIYHHVTSETHRPSEGLIAIDRADPEWIGEDRVRPTKPVSSALSFIHFSGFETWMTYFPRGPAARQSHHSEYCVNLFGDNSIKLLE